VIASLRDGWGTADEGPRGQQVRKRRPPQPAELGYSTQTPNGMGKRAGARRPPTPRYVCHTKSPEARPAASSCAPCGTQALGLPTPVGADLMPVRPLPPCGCTEAVRSRPLAPPARIGHCGPLATVRAAGSHTPSRARVSGVSPIPFAGAGHGVTPTHPFAHRSATRGLVSACGVRGGGSVDLRPFAGTARISLQGHVAYLRNSWILGPVAPLTFQYSRGGLN